MSEFKPKNFENKSDEFSQNENNLSNSNNFSKKKVQHHLRNNHTLKERIDISNLKDKESLYQEYKECCKYITNGSLEKFKNILSNEDNKYYLENNDLDYELFIHAIINNKRDFIIIMENLGYNLNPNLLLIELYIIYISRKYPREKIELKRKKFTSENISFLIKNKFGIINEYNSNNEYNEYDLLEFYFLLMSCQFHQAVEFLDKHKELQNKLNEYFIGDENNLIPQILQHNKITKTVICIALIRKLDGIAFEIFIFSGIFLDETMLSYAIKNDCQIFLEEVWELTRKFGNIKNFYAPKIPFSKYISIMLNEKKFNMASYAIKNWFEAYKEENVFPILLEKNEELAIDLIETASTYNFCIDLKGIKISEIIKERYFLLKVILSKPMYRKYINSDSIQKNLVDALRKGKTIIPAIECYNSIEDHLLSIEYIEKAGKVLLEFLKSPKNFTYCRYPLMLCCLVAEFMAKLKRRFPVNESFFEQIDNNFKKAGELFASKIKDEKALLYHLSRKDIKNRNCLQIMAQNRLYPMLSINYIGNVIERNWNGNSILYGFRELSSFTYIMQFNVEKEFFKLVNITKKFNGLKCFYISFYSYRDIPSIRYYFKELYGIVLVILYQILIYLCVVDKNLENSVNFKYYGLSRTIYFLSLGQAFDKINSMVFFTFVNRWHVEMDPFLLWLSFAGVIFIHWFDLKSVFIKGDSESDLQKKELINAFLLSYQFIFLWYKIIDSLKATKTFGGFLRTIIVIFKKIFLIIVFFYCFILLMTGVFNLLFQQTTQFQSYFDSFFYLAQAALQEYELGERWNQFVNFTLIIFMGICTLVLINLIISYETRIYNEADNDVIPENRANLIKLYEYLRWDENYGIFKFLFAPLNVFQLPFSLFILFPDNKKFWTEIFTKILYFPVAFFYFILFIFYSILKIPLVLFYIILIYPLIYTKNIKKILLHIFLGPILIMFYFFWDLCNFWKYVYKKPFDSGKFKKSNKKEISEFKKNFTSLINVISNRVEKDKKSKRFFIVELLSSWLDSISQKKNYQKEDAISNRIHQRFIRNRKNKNNNTIIYNDKKNSDENNNILLEKKTEISTEIEAISIKEQFKKNFDFLFQLADKDGYIDKEIAKNIFPKQTYYDDDYFECIFYFSFKYFKGIITHFTKMTNQIKKDMNKLRGVYIDFLKINEKYKNFKGYLKNHKFTKDQINTLALGIRNINTFFARLESNSNDEQAKELYEKISKQFNNKQAQTSALQNIRSIKDGLRNINSINDKKNQK